MLAPQQVNQSVAWQRLPAVQDEDRQKRTLTRTAQWQRPLILENLQRPKNPKIKHIPHPGWNNPTPSPVAVGFSTSPVGCSFARDTSRRSLLAGTASRLEARL